MKVNANHSKIYLALRAGYSSNINFHVVMMCIRTLMYTVSLEIGTAQIL